MTQPASTPPRSGALGRIERFLPASSRETVYRYATAIIVAFTAFGMSSDKAALWTNLVVGTITLVFAVLYSPSTVRSALYGLVVVGAAILTAYGIAQNVNWSIIVSSAAYGLGLATAAAKAQTPALSPPTLTT